MPALLVFFLLLFGSRWLSKFPSEQSVADRVGLAHFFVAISKEFHVSFLLFEKIVPFHT